MAQRWAVTTAAHIRIAAPSAFASSSRGMGTSMMPRTSARPFDSGEGASAVASTSYVVSPMHRHLSTTSACASGSNKWSKIRHKKGANDVARGKTNSSISREIFNAIRSHPTQSASPDSNARLAALVRRAKEVDFPKDKLDLAIKRAVTYGTGASGGTSITFEALGPTTKEGTPVALILDCLTDSPARTRSKIREIFNKHNVRLSSTAHLFEKKGVIRLFANRETGADAVFMAAVEAGAEAVQEWEEAADDLAAKGDGITDPVEIHCDPAEMHALASLLSSEPNNHSVHVVEARMLPIGEPVRVEWTEDDLRDSKRLEIDLPPASGFITSADMERLDKIHDLLTSEADVDRVWSNVAGWPAR